MKISLLNPPYSLDDYFGGLSETGSMQQPLGLAYLSSYLKAHGQNVQLIDAAALRYDGHRLIEEVRRFHPDVVGITVTTPGYSRAARLAERAKAELGVPVVAGGPHATSLAFETLSAPMFDYAVLGEGEVTALELLRSMEKDEDPATVKGIAYKTDGKVRVTGPREYIRDLDSLPFPDRESLPPLSAYHPSQSSYRRLPLGTMVTSRGCPHHCIFCDRSVFGNLYRARSAANVVDEMETLIEKHGARELRFWDDTFNLLPKRVLEICAEIRRRKLDVEWSCVARVSNMTDEVLHAMRSAGCWQVDYGVETGNPEVLRGIHKGITMDLVRRAVDLSKSNGLRVRAFFMLGLPGETESTMRETIDFAKNLDLDVAVFHVTTPLPGTELYSIARETGELSVEVDWDKYLMFSTEDPPYVATGLSKSLLREYHRKAYREFYLRPRFILSQLARVRTKEDISRYAKAFTTVTNLD